MKAAVPPAACAWAITCRASVVLPDDSGPNTSMTRPRGKPPTPSAASREMEPVGITLTCCTLREPSCSTEPLPNCFSICSSVCIIKRARSAAGTAGVCIVVLAYWWAQAGKALTPQSRIVWKEKSQMSLRINDEAPNFTAETTQGTINFHEWIGDGWAVLFSH